jgi:hypothetical protein
LPPTVNATRCVDVLHGDLVAGLNLTAERGKSPGEWNDGADFYGLGEAIEGESKKRNRYEKRNENHSSHDVLPRFGFPAATIDSTVAPERQS